MDFEETKRPDGQLSLRILLNNVESQRARCGMYDCFLGILESAVARRQMKYGELWTADEECFFEYYVDR